MNFIKGTRINIILLQITERDKLSKDVCELCQSKLELTRQYFEQIYAAHVKLLGLLREDEGEEGVSVEEEMVEYMRSFETREAKEMILSQPREIVKCEPEIPDLHDAAQEIKETPLPLRDAKHFLDELLEEYEDPDSREDDRADWGQRLGAGRRRGLMVPPPLLRCGECGLVSATHAENLGHWAAEHPESSTVYRSVNSGG